MIVRSEGKHLERLADQIAPIFVWPMKLLQEIAGMTAVAYALERLPFPIPALRAFGARIGDDTIIYPGVKIHGAEKDFTTLCVGNKVRILRSCLLDLTGGITIHDQAILSFGCSLITHLNIYRSPLAEVYGPKKKSIVINRGAVLFANVTVLMGVTIGECSVVGAGSVVTKDVPAWTMVGGVPARQIKVIG